MGRDRSIDAFRGLAIIGMVFFTLSLKLSGDLPELLRHNVRDALHLGDFILPMFLFASGLSLAYFLQQREKKKQNTLLRDVLGRFGKLALVGVSLSFFSAYGFFEMDEVMLCALLFIACVMLSYLDWKITLGIIFLINLSYFGLMQTEWLTIFSGHYLGGYPAAIYYLPIMLVGLITGKGMLSKDGFWCRKNNITIIITFAFFIVFLAIIPLTKIPASPPYIMLSILFSYLFFGLMINVVQKTKYIKGLENIGRTPLRYWLMMYIIFIIPMIIYVRFSGQSFPLHIHWPLGIAISLMIMVLLWWISTFIDRYITERSKR